jgi:hypothetical protein
MPSGRFSSLGRPAVSSASPQPNDPTPGGPTSITQPTDSRPSSAPQAAYPDYTDRNSSPGWDAAVAMRLIRGGLPNLPGAIAGPLGQVLDVISGMVDAVEAMREGKDGCKHLIFRVLTFLQSLENESRGSNVPITESTSTAARLLALKRCVSLQSFSILCAHHISFGDRNIMAIGADALRWSRLNVLDSYLMRDKIKNGVLRHGENLTDCFHTFQVRINMCILGRWECADVTLEILTSIRLVNRVETIASPEVSVPPETPEDTRVRNTGLSTAGSSNANSPHF